MSGYWASHKYCRLNVKDYVEDFCGWTPLKQFIEILGSLRDQAFIATLFLTGGRVSEVLPLTRSNFEIREAQGVVIVKRMRLLKRYKKLSETVDSEGRKCWITKSLSKKRKTFPILIREPLTPTLLKWLSQNDGLLFPSPVKVGEGLSRFWAYKLIRKIERYIPPSLREDLGLNQPFIVDGEKISDHIHLWLHYFRSQRASQLVADYDYKVLELLNYFSWEKPETAVRYAQKGWRGLASKMKEVEITYA